MWSWWQQAVVMVVMVAGGHGMVVMVAACCGHGGHGMVVMVAAGCGHGGSRLWSWWSWWQQAVVMVVMVAGCGHSGSRLWSWWSWWQQAVVTRLHTGHNRLNAHMFKKRKKKSWHHHQLATAVLETRRPNIYCRDMPASADSKNKCVANGSPVIYTPDSTAARRNWRRQLQTGLSV